MKGLSLCANYFHQIGEPLLQDQFSLQWERVAVGLVGKGSDCFGFDDETSRDHHWGPGFSLWLTDEDFHAFGAALSLAYDHLPHQFSGYTVCNAPARLTGVSSIPSFYETLLGTSTGSLLSANEPLPLSFWTAVSEEQLAAAVNGQVFRDPLGTFTTIRHRLQAYYPLSLQREKLAAYCEEAGKSGQHTYLRSLSRNEIMAANGALQRFCEAICRMVYIFNKQFCPRYKWLHHGLQSLPILGKDLYPLLDSLCAHAGLAPTEQRSSVLQGQSQAIEEICIQISHHLRKIGFSEAPGFLLQEHSHAMMHHHCSHR